jgi:hypothetical protein
MKLTHYRFECEAEVPKVLLQDRSQLWLDLPRISIEMNLKKRKLLDGLRNIETSPRRVSDMHAVDGISSCSARR